MCYESKVSILIAMALTFRPTYVQWRMPAFCLQNLPIAWHCYHSHAGNDMKGKLYIHIHVDDTVWFLITTEDTCSLPWLTFFEVAKINVELKI